VKTILKLGIAKSKIYHYNKITNSGGEAVKMSAMVAEKIRKMNLTQSQKEELGITDKDLEKKIDRNFVEKVTKVIDKYKKVVNELAKY
jgi:hypothetical protein